MEKDTKDLLITAAAIAAIAGLIIGGTVAFAGMYPPFTVINSGSMQHAENSDIGIIDAGDIIIVQKEGKHDITTYVEGCQTGYSKFGEHGDVIVYKHPDREVNIIHRAMVELELVESDSVLQKWHIPSLKGFDDWEFRDRFDNDVKQYFWNEDECILTLNPMNANFEFTLTHVGYGDVEVGMPIWSLGVGKDPGFTGYLTKGDNASTNRIFDQNGIVHGLITEDMVVSTAEVEIPWLGSIKLMFNKDLSQNIPSNSKTNLLISFGIIVIAFAALFLGMDYVEKRRNGGKKDENDAKIHPKKPVHRK